MTPEELSVIAKAAREGALIATKRWLSTDEASAYLGIGRSSFLREIRPQIGQTRATHGRPAFDRLEIDALMENRKVSKND